MTTIGKGVNYEVKGSKLIIEIDMTQNYGPSKSGKSTIIATTSGNKSLAGTDLTLGLSLYK
jgi:hypothetical protein